jgi:hypothetical protein
MVYKAFTSSTGTFLLGQLTHAVDNNEVVAFSNQRPVAVQTAASWTAGTDLVTLPLSGPITIDISVWVVRGDYTVQHDRAVAMKIAANAIWDDERMGVTIGALDFHNATANPLGVVYSNFQCGVGNGIRNAMQTAIGKTPGRINVYMVDLVQGMLGRGQSCGFGGGFVALGSAAGDTLLAHEIGHDFTLEHIDSLPADFDDTNVMHPASDVRQYFTEGQLFRAHMAPLSALNSMSVYHARGGAPTRACPQLTSNWICPPIAKRIWADGAFPAN